MKGNITSDVINRQIIDLSAVLPTELWEALFCELDYFDLRLRVSQVCRRFRDILQDRTPSAANLDRVLFHDIPIPFQKPDDGDEVLKVHPILEELTFNPRPQDTNPDDPSISQPCYMITACPLLAPYNPQSDPHKPHIISSAKFNSNQLPFMTDNATSPAVSELHLLITWWYIIESINIWEGEDFQEVLSERTLTAAQGQGVSVGQVCGELMRLMRNIKDVCFERFDFEVRRVPVAKDIDRGKIEDNLKEDGSGRVESEAGGYRWQMNIDLRLVRDEYRKLPWKEFDPYKLRKAFQPVDKTGY